MVNANGRQVDAVKVVDGSAVGKLIIIVVALCAGVSFLDGFDILAISYVAPVIGAAWKLPREAFGPIFAAHYIGAAANIVLSAYAATVYPTAIRSTGVGWVVGWGRIGAIAGAMFGTALVAAGFSIETAYMIAAVPAVIGGIAIALVRAQRQSTVVYA